MVVVHNLIILVAPLIMEFVVLVVDNHDNYHFFDNYLLSFDDNFAFLFYLILNIILNICKY